VTATGSGLALTFILAIAIGVLALILLYASSAVVVLERFARTARDPVWAILFGLAAALVAGALLLHRVPEVLASWIPPSTVGAALSVFACTALATGAAISSCWLLLRKTDAARRGTAVLVVLGLGLALWLGASARVLPLAGPALVLAALLLVFAAFRRRAGREASARAAGWERRLRLVLAALLLGAGIAALLPAPAPRLAAIGQGLMLMVLTVVLLGLLPLAAAGLVASRRSVEWFIALRYLVAKRRQVFISAITAICVGGIAAGVWLIIIVLSVMNGFERTWRDEILGNRAHLVVYSAEGEISDYPEVVARVRDVPGVVAASPYLEADGMVRGRGGEIFSVKVRGIDPQAIGSVTDLPSDLIVGSLEDLSVSSEVSGNGRAETDPGPAGVVLGNQLASTLGTSIGDTVLLISPFGGAPTPLGPAPRLERFRVVGVYQTSFFQYDEVYTYVSLAAAQAFRRAGDVVDGIEVRTTDFYRSRSVGEAISERLGASFSTRDWKEFFPAFFQALRTERVMMFVLLTMIMVVAAFLIVATLVMMIMEKSSDIAILKAMGAADETIERIFAIEGTLIGTAGTVVGVVAGIAVTRQLGWIQDQIEGFTGADALPASVYQFSSLPSEVDPLQVALVAAIAMVLSLGATLLPSRQGASLDPAEGLRYE
jgi:lipoprotein-releasing system permease protein